MSGMVCAAVSCAVIISLWMPVLRYDVHILYSWKKRYGSLGMTEVKELRQLRDENARLKRLVADLTLDKHILSEVVRKKL